ncbi:MAG: hypothetical protein ACXADB_07050 [Candidatus Hermodarchaeia archaeon]|jgi:hypothetical protein
MSLPLHQLWLIVATLILTICSIILLVFRHSIPWVFKYNESFNSLFGIEPKQPSWIQYLFSWLMGTCMATVVFTLFVNMNENLLLLAGVSRIALDPVIISLAVTGTILSILLIVASITPILTMPLSSVSALGILLFLHQYGIPIDNLAYVLSLVSVFVYFAAIAVGFVGVILSLYLLLRTYLVSLLISRYRSRRESPASLAND